MKPSLTAHFRERSEGTNFWNSLLKLMLVVRLRNITDEYYKRKHLKVTRSYSHRANKDTFIQENLLELSRNSKRLCGTWNKTLLIFTHSQLIKMEILHQTIKSTYSPQLPSGELSFNKRIGHLYLVPCSSYTCNWGQVSRHGSQEVGAPFFH